MTMTAPPRPARTTPSKPPQPRRRRPLGSGPRTLISEKELNRTRSRVIYWIALTLTMTGFTIAFVFPLYWMFASAVKSPAEYAQPDPTLIPQTFHPETYSAAWNRLDIAKFFLNTVYYAIGGWLFQIVVDVCAAYALSKLRPMFGKLVLGLMLASLMLPASALLIPAYLTVSDLHLLNTPWALWLPAAANAFNIYVLKRFFDQIPNDLLDAAAIDGAGRLRVLWSVVLPLSRPVLAVISIFAIIAMWKDFLWPLLVLQDPGSQSLSVALSRLAGTTFVTPTELMAGLAIASIPMIAVFLVFQRQILAGLSAGSIKG
jgi:multiple sugar transport system permease protein